MQFNVHGNLEGGVIDVREKSEIEDFLVNGFRTSTTRHRNFESFCSFWSELDKNKVTRVWIDGSFCSNKVDPNDIDCVVFIEPDPNNCEYFQLLRNKHEELLDKYLDVYVCWDKNFFVQFSKEWYEIDYQETYWLGKFGFDRNHNPKEMIELDKEVVL